MDERTLIHPIEQLPAALVTEDPTHVGEIPPADFLRRQIEEICDCTITEDAALQIYRELIGHLLGVTIRTGQCRLPPGFGVLYTALMRPTPGADPDNLPTPIIRYREGDAVRILLGKTDTYATRKKPARVLANEETP